MSTPVLRARDLGARAGADRLLSGVDLDVLPGRVTAVIGASGSGKTTLGLALQGENRPGIALTGAVRLHDTDLLGLPTARRRAARATAIGYLPQHPAAVLNPVRRVGGVLDELASVRHPARAQRAEAVAEALESARVDSGALRRYPHQLSGGQQQRAALAQALVGRPAVLVLDEPATGLDTITKSEIAGTLAGLSALGTGIVLLTHDLGLARRLAHDVAVLRDGRVCEIGPADQVLTSPDHPYTRSLLAAAPGPPAIARISGAESGLHAERIGKTARNGKKLLETVDLRVPPGRRVAIVGRSGAGKTTLARCLAGLTRPDTGRIRLDGVPLSPGIRGRDRRERTRIQYVHQDSRASFDEFRSVAAQLARTARLARGLGREQARAEAERALEQLGLTASQIARRPNALSGGQLQRAALALALLADPAVLICDEITSGQDPATRAALLGRLAGTAAGLVLISHDLSAVAGIADEVHVLDEGRRVEHAPTRVLLSRPRTAPARALIGNADLDDSDG
ncbi:ABC transporter ATP-binding protein [Saccharopolyspora taberi]|uniref:ABC transporter ATP-binding protein n=1 Tax=Saccharopolyspora taberi TaxID=60895 RepID=A0ABN3VFG9_9PSEU